MLIAGLPKLVCFCVYSPALPPRVGGFKVVLYTNLDADRLETSKALRQ